MVDPRVQDFEFRVLRQNRRVVTDESRRAELELFHEVLTDISMCRATQSVRDFIIAAYVRGASIGSAEHTALEFLFFCTVACVCIRKKGAGG